MSHAALSNVRDESSLSRRGLLKASTALFLLSAIHAGCSSAPDISRLTDLAYALFPHNFLAQDVYFDLASQFAEQQSEAASALSQKLEAVADINAWLPKNITDPTLLGYRFFVIVGLYNNLRVTSHFGYQGPSINEGGYLNRGFNDLDWLPEPTT